MALRRTQVNTRALGLYPTCHPLRHRDRLPGAPPRLDPRRSATYFPLVQERTVPRNSTHTTLVVRPRLLRTNLVTRARIVPLGALDVFPEFVFLCT